MRLEAFLAVLIVLADLTGSARAELSTLPPQFSAADTRTIGRNELLRTIVGTDPWLVRRILDVMEQMRNPRRADTPPPHGFDPAQNPDLAGAGRTAEGSVEWLELLKRARAEKEAREKEPAAASGRSAEGSVELIEMMKRARAAKEGGK